MKRILLLAISIPLALFGMHLAGRNAQALDAPHNTNDQSWSITCTRCHYSPSSTPTWVTLPTTTDDTLLNNLCKDCHSSTGMPLADPRFTNVKTHSAEKTQSSYRGGSWTVQCVVCHSPHYQQQATTTAYNTEPGVNVLTGTVSSLSSLPGATSSSLTDTTASFPPNGYTGYLLVPNTVYPARVFRISGNTATKITVDGAINLAYTGVGKTYAIRYGKMINANMVTPLGTKQVKFFNEVGVNSFGSGVNAVCQVCHSETQSFRFDGTKEAGNHPPGVAETQACTSCHPHSQGFGKGGCTDCHGNPPTDGATLVFKDKDGIDVTSDSSGAGAHQKHIDAASLTCGACHTGGMLAGATQGDDRINIGFKIGAVNLGGTYDGTSGRTTYPYQAGGTTTVTTGNTLRCSSVYCHSSGQSANGLSATPVYPATPPSWTNAASGACGTCHGRTAVTLTTGGHTVHLNAPNTGCGDCHTGAADDASSYISKNHTNKLIDVANDYNMGGAPGNGYGTCATASCHQTGIAVNDYVLTPTWGNNVANCTACHANVPATGAHGVHVTSASYDCSACHTGAVKDTSYASAQHLDQNIDVAVGGYPADKAIGSAKQSCTTTCHGSRSPVWDNLSGTEGNCSLCHGMEASKSDGRDTNGDTSALDPQVGAHVAHLTAQSIISSPLSCSDCHTVPAGATYMDKVKAAGHIDGDNRAEVTMASALATTNGASPNYNFGTGTCSNVYCHGARMPSFSTNGTDTQPEWNQTDYLLSTPSKSGDCGKCHGAPPNTGSHSGGESLSQCTTCHDHVNEFGSFNNRVLHIDGMVQASGCTGCHGQPPVDAGTMVNTTVTGRTTRFPASSGGAGAHNLHVNSKSIGCNRCHNSGGDSGHQTRYQVTMGFTYGLNGGLYQAPTFSSPYILRSDGTTTVQITGTVRQCSSVYCHSSGQAANGGAGFPVYGTANWDVPSSGACGACHKTTTGTTLGRIDTGSHSKHLDASATCESCHTGAGTGVAGSPDYTDNASHLNQLIDVASGLSYTGSGVPGNGYATCTTASCHDNGRGVALPTPQWGATVPACTACHALQPATGSHTKHLTGTTYSKAACGDCHDGAVEGATAPVTHLTGSVEVYDSLAGDLGYPTVAKHNDANYQSCTTAYCHSTGQSLSSGTSTVPVYSTVTWSTTVTCGGCHAATKASVSNANSGSHATHLNASVVSGCDACHTGVASDGSAYSSSTASHVDGKIDVASSLSYTGGGLPGNGYATCATASCHSNGKGTYAAPVWGGTSPGCTFCHPTLSGKHASHVVFTNASVYGSTSSNMTGTTASYDFGCGNCHPTSEATNHMNGSVELSLNPADGGTLKSKNTATVSITGSGLTTQCSGVYCHSNGKASPTFVQTPQWQSSFPSSWNTCGSCHGNSPSGSNHGAHVVGIHYNGIYSGSVGLATAGTGTSNSHGNAAYSTTINCNLCHSGAVTKGRNKYGAACSSCHSGDADNATNAMVTADMTKTVHVNGQPDVAFAAVQVKSKAQVRNDITTVAELNSNWTRAANSYKAGTTPYDTAKNALNTGTMWNGGTKTCSNIACHNGISVTWSATVSCGACHTQLP